MKKTLLWSLSTLGVLALWGTLNFLATTQGWGLTPIAPYGDDEAFAQALDKEVAQTFKGNIALALLKKGQLVHSKYDSKGQPVDAHTRFGAASLSKWVTAVGVMTLVEQGKLDLDTPVSTYLTRWQLPPSQFDNNKVTLKLLLSHTAGITDGLGHNGFAPGEAVQPLVEHLTHAKDADEGKSGKVRVEMEPGSKWMYSGGSYNLIQLIIEEVSGTTFSDYMEKAVFQPLGMTNSSFAQHDKKQPLAEYFSENGNIRFYPNYTSLAATGLYTSVDDLVRFANAQLPSSVVSTSGPRLLTDQTLHLMRAPLASVQGLEIWGAGNMLFAPASDSDYVVGHGGKSPYLNSSVRINPVTGDAIIALETGNDDALASNLATYWTVWQTGKPDIYVLSNSFPTMLIRIAIGGIVIIVGAFVFAWSLRRRQRA
ncbi:serine hydrolase domain-containing protein [Pseudoalteromonas xiamenensis]